MGDKGVTTKGRLPSTQDTKADLSRMMWRCRLGCAVAAFLILIVNVPWLHTTVQSN